MVGRAATLLALALLSFGPLTMASSAPSVLRRGSTGPEVRQLQRLLNDWLSKTPSVELRPLAVDGIFGPLTERAVRTFQQMAGLYVDGIVGPRTWARLMGTTLTNSPGPTRARPSPTPQVTTSPPRPTATRAGAGPSATPTSIAGACAGIPAPTNIAATEPNPLCLRSTGAIQLYLTGFEKNQQYRYYIATPAGSARGRALIGHIGTGPLGNGLVILASGTEFGPALAPGNYVVMIEGLPNAIPRATAPFRLLP